MWLLNHSYTHTHIHTHAALHTFEEPCSVSGSSVIQYHHITAIYCTQQDGRAEEKLVIPDKVSHMRLISVAGEKIPLCLWQGDSKWSVEAVNTAAELLVLVFFSNPVIKPVEVIRNMQ